MIIEILDVFHHQYQRMYMCTSEAQYTYMYTLYFVWEYPYTDMYMYQFVICMMKYATSETPPLLKGLYFQVQRLFSIYYKSCIKKK